MTDSTRLWRIPEVADRLGCGREKVYSLIRAGELRVVDLGNGRSKSRVRDDDLAAFIDGRTRDATARRSA